jgi:hypothetical protein
MRGTILVGMTVDEFGSENGLAPTMVLEYVWPSRLETAVYVHVGIVEAAASRRIGW